MQDTLIAQSTATDNTVVTETMQTL